MTTFPSGHPVVVGIDHSPQAQAALRYAADLADKRRLPLRLVHAFERSQFEVGPRGRWSPDMSGALHNAAQQLVDEALDFVHTSHPAVEVASRLEPGSSTEQLIGESETAHTVVVGTRGSGGFADMLIGSTTLHVASHARCPVVAVPASADESATRSGVVVGVDGSAVSEPAIAYAFDAAADRGTALTAVHAWYDITRTGAGKMMPLTYEPDEVVAEERLALAESMAGWQEKYPDVHVEHKVVYGHPVPALLKASRDAELLVVGCRGLGTVRSVVLGSVSHGVLHHATLPVAVVHAAC